MLEGPIVALVKGPKRTGKSTFGRALLNKLLEQHKPVAWLECDLGQAEFGCGGVVGICLVDQHVFGAYSVRMTSSCSLFNRSLFHSSSKPYTRPLSWIVYAPHLP